MMPFVVAELANLEDALPLYVYCVGNHEQKRLDRREGYPAQQIFLTRSGRGAFRLRDGRQFTMTPGTLFILPADVPHEYFPDDADSPWDLGFVAFRGNASPLLLEQMGKLVLSVLQAADFDRLWQQLESLWHLISLNEDQAYWESSKKMYGIALSVMEDQRSVERMAKASASSEPNAALATAVRLMHDHYNEKLLTANVARAAGYSVQHFHRLFVAAYGTTPQQYLLRLRMRRSVQLFQEQPGISVEKVAELLGMETSYFIRMFKRTYGRTPKQHAKN
ncbi:AraC family transcriptional regulator [Cohnella suwonensis]|uniref:AraC family transcriptional regulator n=1 Tax=Cohnella suwonensis TaxID=696072 RepID=A0ABW0LYJ8_9BACL